MNKQNCSKKWAPYRIAPLQQEIDNAIEFSKNFINEDGTICEVSLAILFIKFREFERRMEELECEVRELRCMQEQ